MKPILAIPSYKRSHTKILAKLKHIPLAKYLFIRPEDCEDYKSPAEANGFKVIKLKNVTDIGNTRAAIVNYCHLKGFDWVFLLDDDISKLECLAESEGRITSARILYEPDQPPRFETRALKLWYELAKRNHFSLSSPNHRAYDRFKHGTVQINSSACIQCVLLYVPDIIEVGNYRSLRLVGNEDYYLQFKLMEAGKQTAKIGSIEYDCPSVGAGKGGNNADEYTDINKRYELYVQAFLDNVCSDPDRVTTKITSSGQKSIQLIWKNWRKPSFPVALLETPFKEES